MYAQMYTDPVPVMLAISSLHACTTDVCGVAVAAPQSQIMHCSTCSVSRTHRKYRQHAHRDGSGSQDAVCRPTGEPSSTTASAPLRASQMRMTCMSLWLDAPTTNSPSRDCCAQVHLPLCMGSRNSVVGPRMGALPPAARRLVPGLPAVACT